MSCDASAAPRAASPRTLAGIVRPHVAVALAVVVGVAVKGVVVATRLPRPWLFPDELFYLLTAYDFAAWGTPGVPHPGFLFYPPLTSAAVAPLHLLGLPSPLVYHGALLLFGVAVSSTVIPAQRMCARLFGAPSTLLAVVLTLAPPAYGSLVLMSEPLFVTLYVWFVAYYLAALQTGSRRHSFLAALLLAAMALTRTPAALLVTAATGALAAITTDGARWKAARRQAWMIALPALASVAWLVAKPTPPAARGWSPTGWAAIAMLAPADFAAGLLRRIGGEIGYVSLSTAGVCLPLSLAWGLWTLRAPSCSRGDRRTITAHVGISLLATAAMASAFMWVGSLVSDLPRWTVYGRYVDYFATPLVVVAIGASRLPSARRGRVALALFALLLNALLVACIPEEFFTDSLARDQVAPNSLGIAWLFEIVRQIGPWARWLAAPLSAALVWALCSPRLRRGAGVAIALLFVANYILAARTVSRQSFGSAVYSSDLSRTLERPSLLHRKPLYVDWSMVQSGSLEGAHLVQIYRLLTDHPAAVIAVPSRGEAVGRYPLLTASPGDCTVMAAWPHLPFRVVSACHDPAAEPPPSERNLIQEGTTFEPLRSDRDPARREGRGPGSRR